jgi:hypothetical protein
MTGNKDMQVKLILSDSYLFYLRNFHRIASLCLPFLFLDAFLESLFNRSENLQALHWVSYVMIYPVYTAALILFMARSAGKEQAANMDIIAAALKLWWPFYLLTVIHLTLGAVGLFLFIVPGIWIIVRLSFAEYYLVLDGLNPLDAIRQSIETTKPYFWYLLAFLVVTASGNGIADYLIGRAFHIENDISILSIAANAAVSLIMLFFDVVLFRIFMEVVVENSAE